MKGWHGIFEHAMQQLPTSKGQTTATLLNHGTLKVMLYKPQDIDRQIPHDQDEIYVVAKGSGQCLLDGSRFSFQQGDVIFAAAGVEHCFEDFSDDFATWVLFYGPIGGE
ncbi:MAG: cupin domain-containing protein [Methyloligellaceae bacterium]